MTAQANEGVLSFREGGVGTSSGDVAPSVSANPLDGGGKLRVALLGYRSQPYSGGQGVYIRYLARALRDAGHEVTVISGEPYPILDNGVELVKMPGLNLFAEANAMKAFKWRYLWQPTNLYEYLSHNSGGFPEPYTFNARLKKWMKKNAHRFDVIHDNQSLGKGLLGLRKMGLPVVATIHHPITVDREIAIKAAPDFKFRLLARRWHTFLNMQIKVARKLDHIVTVSECSRRDIARDFKVDAAKMEVVFNGIDTEMFDAMPNVQRLPNRLMAIASADHPLKGLNYLIEALGQLRQTREDLELLVVGAPKPGGQTEQLIKRLGLEDAITFRHGLEPEEIVELYAEATIAVSPSVYEGFGLPAAEAMACGVPLVAAAGGALPEVVGDAGIVVPTRDSAALAEAIEGLLQDDARRATLAREGRARILELFTWDRAAQETLAVYHEAIAHAHRSV